MRITGGDQTRSLGSVDRYPKSIPVLRTLRQISFSLSLWLTHKLICSNSFGRLALLCLSRTCETPIALLDEHAAADPYASNRAPPCRGGSMIVIGAFARWSQPGLPAWYDAIRQKLAVTRHGPPRSVVATLPRRPIMSSWGTSGPAALGSRRRSALSS